MQSAVPSQATLVQSSKPLQATIPGKIVLSVAASALIAVCAHIALPLPFTPVPITLQTFAVILIGMILGPAIGSSAAMLYLAEGALGMPVFSPHGPGGLVQLLGPTAGYLFSYPVAAAVAGWIILHARWTQSRFSRAVTAGIAASIFTFAMGAGWLAWFGHLNALTAWHAGVAPFLPGEAVKVTACAGIFSSLQRWMRS
jgi:biotin transport system substrate-specific component